MGGFIKTNSSQSPKYIITNGTMIIAQHIDCKNCYQYSYALQLHCDIKNQIISKTVLNSEEISFKKDLDNFNIRNAYTINKTECYYTDNSDMKKLSFPLLSENINKPYELLERVQKLVLYS